MSEPLAAFEDGIVDAVADDRGVDSDRLRELLEQQQRLVREFPDMTVEALVHDWRRAFPEDPLVATTEVAYYLSVREGVWDDVVSRLDLPAEDREALRALNARQFEVAQRAPAGEVAIVLTK